MNRTVVAALAACAMLAMSAGGWNAHAGPELKVTADEAGLDCEGCGGAPATKVAATKVATPGGGTGGIVKEGDGGTKVGAPGEGTAIAPVAEAAPTVQYVIAAIVTVEGKPVWFGILQTAGPFDDKAACDAMLDDPGVKAANDGLAVKVLEIHPDAKVDVSCKAIPVE